MTPQDPRPSIERRIWKSSLGPIGLVMRNGRLAGVCLNADATRFPNEVELTYGTAGKESEAPFDEIIGQLEDYLSGRRLVFRLELDLEQGTPFQRRVWRTLREIPYGETVTYKEIATAIGQPSAVRAVGSANGQNPVPIVVPCHRVVATGGKIGGFSGGLDLKRKLLDLETRTRMEASQFGMLSERTKGTLRPRPWR